VVRRAVPAVRIARVTKQLDGLRAVIVLGDDVDPACPRTATLPQDKAAETVTDVVASDLVFRPTREVEGSGRTVSCTPRTGEIVAELPESAPHDVEVAFGRAREAQRG